MSNDHARKSSPLHGGAVCKPLSYCLTVRWMVPVPPHMRPTDRIKNLTATFQQVLISSATVWVDLS